MRMKAAGLLGVSGVALALSACQVSRDVGYVEIRTVPAITSASQPALYLDSVKLDPLRKGVGVLTQRVGTASLATEAGGQMLPLCEVVVKKNRITTVTVSVLERPPRCQCRNGDKGTARTCIS